jgi:hypothetical protein
MPHYTNFRRVINCLPRIFRFQSFHALEFILFFNYKYDIFQAKKYGSVDKSFGTLLYHLATKLKGQSEHFRPLLARYITERKLNNELQLNGI